MVKHMKECQKVQKAKAKKKNMCVSDRPTDPKILPPTLTFFMPIKNGSAKSGNLSQFPCLFPTSTIFFISLYI